MRIEQKKEGNKNFFYAYDEENGQEMGHLIFSFISDDTAEVFHTDVQSAYRGQDVGKRILMKLVEHARENNLKLIADCTFIESCYDKMQEIRDVLSKKEE